MTRKRNLEDRSQNLTPNSNSNSNSNRVREFHLDPDRDADKIIRLGLWEPYADRIINNGKWKAYDKVSYTFREAAAIENNQKATTERQLSELREMFKPLPQLNEEQKKENERLYWDRIRREIKANGWDK
jgi:hypothetical protein